VKGSFSIIIALLWFVVLLTTGLFFLILTVQKTGSLTVLRAVGATGKTLVVSLLWQVAIVLFFGSIIAIAGFVASTLFIGKNLGLKAEPAVIAGSVGLLAFLALLGTGLGALRRIVSIDPVAAVAPQGGLR
jgi:putative ABC transport system permease protein